MDPPRLGHGAYAFDWPDSPDDYYQSEFDWDWEVWSQSANSFTESPSSTTLSTFSPESRNANGERAVSATTAMTSPHDAIPDHVGAAAATQHGDENLDPNPDLDHNFTATEAQSPPGANMVKQETSPGAAPKDQATENPNAVQAKAVTPSANSNGGGRKVEDEVSHAMADMAAIPQLPTDDFGVSAFNQVQQRSTWEMAMQGVALRDGLLPNVSMNAFTDQALMEGYAMMPLDRSPEFEDEQPETQLQAFAKLTFGDTFFYVSTYQVVLGRDMRAWKKYLRKEAAANDPTAQDQDSNPRESAQLSKGGSRSFHNKSVASESGIQAVYDDSDYSEDSTNEKGRKAKKSKKSKKSSKASRSGTKPAARSTANVPEDSYQVRRTYETAVPVDPVQHRPSPTDCPIVPIHPMDGQFAAKGKWKTISRKHVKIKYNARKSYWQVIVLGRNGVFINNSGPLSQNEKVRLQHSDVLQIGDVQVMFELPDGQEAHSSRSESGKEMSFDFEDARRSGVASSSNGEEEDGDGEAEAEAPSQGEVELPRPHNNGVLDPPEAQRDSQEDDEDRDDNEQEEGEELQQEPTWEYDDMPVDEALPLPTTEVADMDIVDVKKKKKGPGRPPKNGVMSKREERELKQKRAAEAAAAEQNADKNSANRSPLPGKKKVGRPRKHPEVELPPDGEKREKRKYTKRKQKEPKEGEAEGNGSDQDKANKKNEKPPRPPRSPTPTYDEAELTEEQMQKPSANYVSILWDVLKESEVDRGGSLSLPQIYRAIQRKYPFFVVKCQTIGWQSSVRHNLSQNACFSKNERDGKGWKWGIVPGSVHPEKEKKKRASPVPQPVPGHMQNIHPAGPYPHMMQGYPPHYGMPVQGYQQNGQYPGYYYPGPPQNGQPPHGPPHGYPSMGPAHMPPIGVHHPPPGHPPPGPIPSVVAAIAAPPTNGNTYSSPYASKPATTSGPQGEQRLQPQQQPPNTYLHQAQYQNQSPYSQPPAQQPQQFQPPASTSTPPIQNIKEVIPMVQTQPQAQMQAQIQPQDQNKAPLNPDDTRPQSQPQTQAKIQPQIQPQHPQPQTPRQDSPPKSALVNDEDGIIERFKASIVTGMQAQGKHGQHDIEAIVDSAIARVKHNATTNLGGDTEDRIVGALKRLLTQSKGSGQAVTNSIASQSMKSTGSEMSAPTIARPSFNRPPMSRPPMNTPGIKRTNSDSPLIAQGRIGGPSASPAPIMGLTKGVSTPQIQAPVAAECAQIAGQKRPHEDSPEDDTQQHKKINTTSSQAIET